MVRTRATRPRLRPKGSSPERTRRPARKRSKTLGEPPSTRKYPNMEARKEWDRQEHVRRGRAMGLTRRQARLHAQEEVRED